MPSTAEHRHIADRVRRIVTEIWARNSENATKSEDGDPDAGSCVRCLTRKHVDVVLRRLTSLASWRLFFVLRAGLTVRLPKTQWLFLISCLLSESYWRRISYRFSWCALSTRVKLLRHRTFVILASGVERLLRSTPSVEKIRSMAARVADLRCLSNFTRVETSAPNSRLNQY